MSPIDAFTLGLFGGMGLTLGYFLINLTLNYALARAQISLLKKAREGKETKKLCPKCKKNPRPEGGLYCQKCRFSSGDKFQ